MPPSRSAKWYIVGSENCTLAGSAERFDIRVKGSPNRMIVRLSGAPYLVPAAHDVVEVRTRNPPVGIEVERQFVAVAAPGVEAFARAVAEIEVLSSAPPCVLSASAASVVSVTVTVGLSAFVQSSTNLKRPAAPAPCRSRTIARHRSLRRLPWRSGRSVRLRCRPAGLRRRYSGHGKGSPSDAAADLNHGWSLPVWLST